MTIGHDRTFWRAPKLITVGALLQGPKQWSGSPMLGLTRLELVEQLWAETQDSRERWPLP